MTRPAPIRSKVLVAMSGGVDSSVAAALLVEQGYDVLGLFMRVGATLPVEPDTAPEAPPEETATGREHQGCCSAADAADARHVAGLLGIPFYALNFKPDFERIIDYFAAEYGRGRTPNPCVLCNTWLKFGKLLEYAEALGAGLVATGHYARMVDQAGQLRLARAHDARKDQSYFLYGIRPEALQHILFPIGHLTKDAVRAEARRRGLPVTDKPDSVEICFVSDGDYARVVRARQPASFQPGPVLDTQGRHLGTHAGLPNYTIGQRHGLGIATGRPAYVTSLDVAGNRVILGERTDLLRKSLWATEPNFFEPPPATPRSCTARIRYQHQPAACTAVLTDDGRLRVDFVEPQSAITPGQAVVLYDNDIVLGGGCIAEAC